MDWFMDSSRVEAVPLLRAEARDYLERHAEPGSELHAAELAVSELVSNAVQHAGGPVWVSIEWGDEKPTLTVRDLGPGFRIDELVPPPATAERGRGLFIVSRMTEELEVAQRRGGGASVKAVLPVRRKRDGGDVGPAVARPALDALPGPEEAREDGTFGRESFLRALTVQLARALERQHGPEASEAAVAQVGTDIGGRMEEEYRRARGIMGDLSSEQIADLYVRLKHAIEGDFYVIEADEERIVLGNRRCPFGEAVKRSPSLCWMTSSVFGGIAARNRGQSAVQLDERIAIGDPGCRVVVWLGEAARRGNGSIHRYTAAGTEAAST